MTEHTLIFVQRGIKLLHFPGETVRASPGEVFLLRKGIYVMAEYIEESADFEAMMLFLPLKQLQAMAMHSNGTHPKHAEPYLVFPATPLLNAFKESFRQYFGQPPAQLEQLMRLKQQEVLLLLLSGPQRNAVQAFIRSAIDNEVATMEHIVSQYLLQPVTIEELASLCNRSLAKFKRDFQKQYNCPPRTWINNQRLAHAHLLLQNTDQQITGIAMDCGFENTSWFIRLYKKKYGHTPATERAK